MRYDRAQFHSLTTRAQAMYIFNLMHARTEEEVSAAYGISGRGLKNLYLAGQSINDDAVDF